MATAEGRPDIESQDFEIELEGVRLEARQLYPRGLAHSGSGELVLLHEGLGSVSAWRDFPAALAAASGRGVMVYSRRGYGRSDGLDAPQRPDFMHREAEVLDALLRTRNDDRPILVGHSDGGSIALIHAARSGASRSGPGSPIAPRALVLLAPHVFVEERTLAAIRAARDAFANTDLALRLARHHDDPLRTFRGWNDIWLDPAFRSWDIRENLAAIRFPILAIQGEDDPYGTMAQLDEIATRVQGPLTQLRLERCGHAPHRDRPREVLRAIAEFVGLGGLPPSP